MNDFIVVAGVGVGDLKFNMDRALVRTAVGACFKEFKKNKFSKNVTDDFGLFHAFYDDADRLEAVEFFEDVGLWFDDIDLVTFSYKDLEKLMSKNDTNLKVGDHEFTSIKNGICASSVGSEEDSPVSSILVFRPGYFD